MCGIFAYYWDKRASNFLLNWLKDLEYRWYDSAWICEVDKYWKVYIEKSVWKVSNLAEKVNTKDNELKGFNIGIAHTRWATHWEVTIENTHPHKSENDRFYIVHNWIIENYIELKNKLSNKWYSFYSDTDTEIIAKLIEDEFENDIVFTIKKIIKKISWAYALAIIDRKDPEKLVWIKKWSPLILGINNDEYFLSSDIHALKKVANDYIILDDNEVVILENKTYSIISSNSWEKIEKTSEEIKIKDEEISLGDFSHYMEKEIFETPRILEAVLSGRINFENHEIKSNTLEEISKKEINKIEIIASWTSYNSWLVASYWFEEIAEIETSVHIWSEYKYKKKFINDNTLYIFISQSWETADSLECLKIIKNKWWTSFWIVNVVASSIARLSDFGLYTHSGTEIWVAATKSFIWQLWALLILAMYLWNKRNLDYIKYIEIINNLEKLKDDLREILLNSAKIAELAKHYTPYKNFFFLGRNLLYPIAMEWSLKCKEITYRHTESYSAWELKHWPLSLIDKDFPTILINPSSKLRGKNISTLKEIKARKWKVIWVISKNDKYKDLYDDYIEVPETIEELSPFTTSVALQLFSYYLAKDLKREIDKPRNLAKSVTVE